MRTFALVDESTVAAAATVKPLPAVATASTFGEVAASAPPFVIDAVSEVVAAATVAESLPPVEEPTEEPTTEESFSVTPKAVTPRSPPSAGATKEFAITAAAVMGSLPAAAVSPPFFLVAAMPGPVPVTPSTTFMVFKVMEGSVLAEATAASPE